VRDGFLNDGAARVTDFPCSQVEGECLSLGRFRSVPCPDVSLLGSRQPPEGECPSFSRFLSVS